MIPGVYKAEYSGDLGLGAAILFIKDGVIHGVDPGFWYDGTYSEAADKFDAKFCMRAHGAPEQLVTGAVGSMFDVPVKGRVAGDQLFGTATIRGEAVQFTAKKIGDMN
jgi:hypothetical protein